MMKKPSNRMVRLLAVVLATCFIGFAPVSPAQEMSQGQYVNFNFDGVEIRLLIKLVGDMTGRQFVVDDTVEGKVTVVTPQQIPIDEVYPLFLSILESSGYSVIKRGDIYQVVPLSARTVSPATVVKVDEEITDGGIITKVIKLKNVSANEMRKVLEPMVGGGQGGAIAAFGPTNHLIITDTAENIRKIEDIVAEVDKEGASGTVEVVFLEYASAEDIAAQINAAMLGAEKAGTRLSRHVRSIAEGGGSVPGDVVVVPATQANSLVLVGSAPEIAELKRVIAMLDTEGLADRGPLNAIFLKYLSAEDAAKGLNALLEKTEEKDARKRIAIEPDIANNALMVHASPRDYEWVKELVDRLDKVPQQVLVEILIAEVSMGESLDLGVEWATIDEPAEGKTTVLGRSRPGETDTLMDFITAGITPQGLAVGVAHGVDSAGNPSIPVILRALGEDRDWKILSSVPLWAQNNKEASVNVVENIPILKSTIEGGAGTARDTIQNIERIDVGIKLTLTPHVNPDREILLELNPSIEAVIDEGPADRPFTPTIAKREVSTTVTVPDGSTVAISGLIRDDRITRVSKVPLLGDIPILGALFRSSSDSIQRSNLLIFVTPHIVTDINEATRLRDEWEGRTGLSSSPTNLSASSLSGE